MLAGTRPDPLTRHIFGSNKLKNAETNSSGVFVYKIKREIAGTNDSGVFTCKIEKKTPKLSVSAFLHVKSKGKTPKQIVSASNIDIGPKKSIFK